MPRADTPATPALRLLGGLGLPEPPPVRSRQPDPMQAAAQPKRIALLTYLALATPRGLHQRDHLLGLLWPDSDDARARAALSQSLYALRRAFGGGLLQKRGQQVGLAPASLVVDVLAFEAAVSAGAHAEALALYAGDLLPGFHVARAPEFEFWLEGERARLRELAYGAAHEGSEAAWRDGDVDAAVRMARRAWDLSGRSEAAVRHLLALLQEAGDVAGALAVFEVHAAAMRREDREPEPRTLEMVRLLKTLEGRTTPRATTSLPSTLAPTPVAETPGAAAPSLANPPAGPVSMRPAAEASEADTTARPAWWRNATLAAAAVVAIILAGTWLARRPDSADAATAATRVAVLPFTVRGDSSLGYMAEGMVDLLSARLDGAGAIRAVDPAALLHFIHQRPGDAADDAWVGRVIAHFRAGLHVTGTLVRTGTGLQATAALRDAAGRVLGRGESSVASEQDLATVVDELARSLLTAQFAGPGERLQRVAVTTTGSFPALKAYLEGEAAARRGRHDEAFAAYSRAVELDSTFALAHYRLARASDWVGAAYLIAPSLQSALRYGDRLDDHERRLVRALDRYWHGSFLEAERAYASLVEIYPDDMEAWHQYGEVQMHWGPLMGRSSLLAEPSFERVLGLDPDEPSALSHLARLAAARGDVARTDRLVRRVVDVAPDFDRTPEIHLLRAYVTGDSADVRRQLAALPDMSASNVWTAAWRVAAYARDPIAASAIIRANLQPERRPEARLVALQSLAHFAAARGRWREAGEALEEAARLDPRRALATSAFLAALPFSPATPAELQALRQRLAAPVIGPQVPPSTFAVSMSWALDRRVLDAMLATRAGNDAPARALLDSLRTAGLPGRGPQRLLMALTAGGAADLTRRAALDTLMLPAEHRDIRRDAEFSYALEHFLVAEQLRFAGRDDDALAWYASFGDDFGYDIAFLAPAYLHRAGIHDRLGQRDRAIACYEAFLHMWKDPDPELRTLTDRARARIAALRLAGG